jgi:hypothetical protein
MSAQSIEVKKRFVRSYEELRYHGYVKYKKDFCEAVGFGVSNFIRLEKSDNYEPGIDNLLRLCTVYPVSTDWLLWGKGECVIKLLHHQV